VLVIVTTNLETTEPSNSSSNSSVAEIEVVNNASTSYGISKMSLFGGTGINWNGLTNLQTTAEDSAGNISID